MSELCSLIGIVEAGKLIAQGPLNEIYEQLHISRVIHLQVLNLDEKMQTAIEKLEGVRQFSLASDRQILHIDEATTSPETILAQIVTLGASIRMFQPEAMDLETVFMKLTEGKTS